MSLLVTYWMICLTVPVVLALWVYTVHRDMPDEGELDSPARKFSWRRDFGPAAVAFTGLFILIWLI